MNALFWRRQQIISGIENIFTELDWKQKLIFNTLPVVGSCRPGDNLLFPSTLYIYLGCSSGCLLRQHIFRKHPNCSYYFYIVKYYARYNNHIYLYPFLFPILYRIIPYLFFLWLSSQEICLNKIAYYSFFSNIYFNCCFKPLSILGYTCKKMSDNKFIYFLFIALKIDMYKCIIICICTNKPCYLQDKMITIVFMELTQINLQTKYTLILL